MSWIKNLFDDNSSISLLGVLSALVIVSAVILSFISLFTNVSESIIYALLGSGFTGKAIKKYGDRKK